MTLQAHESIAATTSGTARHCGTLSRDAGAEQADLHCVPAPPPCRVIVGLSQVRSVEWAVL